MSEQHKQTLQRQLWNIANSLRGNMGADEFRDYILGFIFYKYLSEKIHLHANKILKEDGLFFEKLDPASAEDAEVLSDVREDCLDTLGYYLEPNELFSALAAKGQQERDNFIIEDLQEILKHIEQSTMGAASEDDFTGLFDDIDLSSNKLGKTAEAKNALIARVLAHLDAIDFQLENTEIDVLGDAYEYLIGQFASGAGKSAGEFYTPQAVSTLLAKIVTHGKDRLKSVYDPTCGSGSLLLRVAREVKTVGHFYGQESNPTTYNLARMNMILHGVHFSQFDIQQDDTLEYPHHKEERFEAVVANPPFSANWSANPLHLTDERFADYGKLAPKGKADFAFVQHMIHQLDDNGTMAVVLPHGVLFRGAAENHIRRFLVENRNYIDAIIGLPKNIFYGTEIPTCILVLKKQRALTGENSDNILFIDSSAYFGKGTNQNYLRDEDIKRIFENYKSRETVDKFAYVAPLTEVEENEFNLNIPRYVDTFEEEAPVDLASLSKQITDLDKDIEQTDAAIAEFCHALSIETPFGVKA
ncbi:type I restriction-modification system subunit M [Endozoicomonas atrinae]|uniref:type I restriction-modification system subunit M n=1 Tax=Endozoicomonas atrinae TaxID=1333660 RepID=UPI000824D0C6|nr:type I restriction-modification system subunit M [Endozoicomonas atrinae]